MSLFEDHRYQWRETYFVLFPSRNRPTAARLRRELERLGDRYEVREVRGDEQGRFESLTVLSPFDFSAMDISYVEGEDVAAQVAELRREAKPCSPSREERAKWDRLTHCDARFEIYHFEQLVDEQGEEEDEVLDPGALLVVMDRLARLTEGVSIDPQTGALM